MNILPSEILTEILIPKYLEYKYNKYSYLFKIDIFDTSQKYKKVVNEFNKHIQIFNEEDMFKLMPDRLNYFNKLKNIHYKTHGFGYKNTIKYPKYLNDNEKKFYVNRYDYGVINNFVIKDKKLTNMWKSLIFNYTEYYFSDDEFYLNNIY